MSKNSATLIAVMGRVVRVIRFSIVLVLFMILEAKAGAIAQTITLNVKNAQLGSIFKEIRQQSGYDFFFNKELMQKCKPVSINVHNASIESVLNQCLQDQPLTYKIENKVVMIREKEAAPRLSDENGITIEGRVIDSTGTPLIGASIRVKSSKLSTATDGEGHFQLSGVEPGATLIISYVGFLNREVKVTEQNASNLVALLHKDINKLSEVAVISTGYQTLSKERSAGSFATANMDVVVNRSSSMNILQNLDGQLPGLVVNNAPNRNQFLVRGLSTIGAPAPNGNTGYSGTSPQPLYVVDGLAVPDVSTINPQDVESVTLLKDATAASIWGARAANGVIVITTKKGAFNSKLRVNYDAFINYEGKPDLDYAHLLNSHQFIEAGKEIFNTDGYLAQYPWANVSTINGGGIAPHELILYNLSRGLITQQQADASLDSLANIDNHSQIKDLLYRSAVLSNHTLSLSGGSDKYSFYGSASYTNTVNNTPGQGNKNYKINVRQDIKATKFLRFNIITDLSENNTTAKRNLNTDYFFYPYQLFRDGSGNNLSIPFMTNQSDSILRDAQARSRISLDYDPLNEFNTGYTRTDNTLARVNTGVSLDIIKGLRFEGNYGYIKGGVKTRDYDNQQSYVVRRELVSFTVAPNATTTPKYYLPATGGRLTTTNGDQRNWTVRNQLIFDRSWNKHAITALAGQEAQEQFSSTQMTRVRGYDEDLENYLPVDYNVLASLILNTVLPNYGVYGSLMSADNFSYSETTTRFTSYYGNAAYTYDHRYTINGSWRNDQSNLFGKNKSAQNKPVWSVGGKWNISSEAFMQNTSWLDRLDLRLTYGITGNSPNPGVAASSDIVGPLSSTFFPGGKGSQVITPGNKDLSWESTKTTNLGVDYGFFNGRLNGSLDGYLKNTDNLLGLIYPNSLNGWPAVIGNQGSIKNKGIEASIQSVNVRTKDFSWSTFVTFAYNKNMVTKVTTPTPITTGAQQVATNYIANYPAFAQFAYNYAGLNNQGIPQVKLADGTISKDQLVTKPGDIVFAGTLQPVWNGGFSNTFQYKAFRLVANMVYDMGNVMPRYRNLQFGGQLHRNLSVDFLNRWKQPGDEAHTDIPGYVTNSNVAAATANYDYFTKGNNNIVDASFLKLRDVTLFYDLPRSLLQRVKIQGVTLRAQVSNILLWKANKYDIDPEFLGAIAPSNQKTITLGAHITL
jgi:TonB-linked SusC/RagA family outer membrane protein